MFFCKRALLSRPEGRDRFYNRFILLVVAGTTLLTHEGNLIFLSEMCAFDSLFLGGVQRTPPHFSILILSRTGRAYQNPSLRGKLTI